MTLTAWWTLSLQEMKKIFSYRATFWIQFIGSAGGEIAVAYLLWQAIYVQNSGDLIGGFTFAEMVRYYVFSALLSRVIRGAENFQISHEIYDGSLTRFLIYPGSYFSYKLSERFSFLLITLLQAFAGVLGYTLIFHAETSSIFTVSGLTMSFFLAVYSAFFNFILTTIVELVAFWVDNVWSLSMILRFITGFLSGMMLPLSLYPSWVQQILNLTPFPSMIYIPVQLALGRAGAPQLFEALLIITAWLIPLGFGLNLVWKNGVRRYTGVGQ